MKRNNFKTVCVNLDRETLDQIIDSFLINEFPTRSTVNRFCGKSAKAISTVANALVETNIMGKKLYKDVDSTKSELHYTLSPRLCVVVIDISSSIFKISAFSKSLECIFFDKYVCNPELFFEDNFILFLSRCLAKLIELKIPYDNVCLIYSENSPDSIPITTDVPSIHNKEAVENIVAGIMRRSVLSHTTVSRSFADAKKYKLCDFEKGACYLFFGTRLLLVYINDDGSVFCSYPERLIIKEQLTVRDRFSSAFTDSEFTSMLCLLSNFAVSAFDPQTLFISSDTNDIDKNFIENYLQAYSTAKYTPPRVRVDSSRPSLYVKGAAVSAIAKLIKANILTNAEYKNTHDQ